MSNDKTPTLIGLHSEWVGASEMRTKTREFGNTKIVVDVIELTHGRTSKVRATKAAQAAARLAGVESVSSFVLLSDQEIARKSSKLDGSSSLVHIRQMCFVFEGVE